MDAFTVKFFPKYLLMVFAFAGDSTITSDLAMLLFTPLPSPRRGPGKQCVSFSLPLAIVSLAGSLACFQMRQLQFPDAFAASCPYLLKKGGLQLDETLSNWKSPLSACPRGEEGPFWLW